MGEFTSGGRAKGPNLNPGSDGRRQMCSQRVGSTTHNKPATLVIYRPLLGRLSKRPDFSATISAARDFLLLTWYSRSASRMSSAIPDTARMSLRHSSYPSALTRL